VAWPPTTDDLLNLVEGGVFQRADQYRFDLTDHSGDVIGQLTPDYENPPRMTNDTTRAVMRTIDQLVLPASESNHVDGIRDRLRVTMVLENGAEFEMGTFLWGDDTHPVREWGHEHHSVLVDLLHPFTSPRGKTSSSKLGANVITRAGDHARLIESSVNMDIVPDPSVLTAPLGWTPTDTLLRVINDHLALVSYLPMHYDRHSRLQMRPVPDVDNTPVDISYGDAGRIERDSITMSDDLLQAPNEFVVYDSSAQGAPRIGRYQVPASAPHSVENRSYVWRRVEGIQGLASQAAADKAAKALAVTDRNATFDWRTWTSAADPRHDTFNVISFYGVPYLEVRWSLVLAPGGPMTHQARRVY
jgi:hypothetical protein